MSGIKYYSIITSLDQCDGETSIAEGVILNKRKTSTHISKPKKVLIIMVLNGSKCFSYFGDAPLA